jgi:hypothetical protein
LDLGSLVSFQSQTKWELAFLKNCLSVYNPFKIVKYYLQKIIELKRMAEDKTSDVDMRDE